MPAPASVARSLPACTWRFCAQAWPRSTPSAAIDSRTTASSPNMTATAPRSSAASQLVMSRSLASSEVLDAGHVGPGHVAAVGHRDEREVHVQGRERRGHRHSPPISPGARRARAVRLGVGDRGGDAAAQYWRWWRHRGCFRYGLHLAVGLTVADRDPPRGVADGRAAGLHRVEVPAVLDQPEDQIEQRDQYQRELDRGSATFVAPSPEPRHAHSACLVHHGAPWTWAQVAPLCVAEIRRARLITSPDPRTFALCVLIVSGHVGPPELSLVWSRPPGAEWCHMVTGHRAVSGRQAWLRRTTTPPERPPSAELALVRAGAGDRKVILEDDRRDDQLAVERRLHEDRVARGRSLPRTGWWRWPRWRRA